MGSPEMILAPQRRTQSARNRWNLLEKVLSPKYMVDGVQDEERRWQIQAQIQYKEEITPSHQEDDLSLSVSVKIVQKEMESDMYESWDDREAERWRVPTLQGEGEYRSGEWGLTPDIRW